VFSLELHGNQASVGSYFVAWSGLFFSPA